LLIYIRGIAATRNRLVAFRSGAIALRDQVKADQRTDTAAEH